MNVFGVALGGLNEAQASLENTAGRISAAVDQPDSASLSADAVALFQAKNDFAANVNVIKIADEVQKATIDLLA